MTTTEEIEITETASDEPRVYHIKSEYMPTLEAKIAKLNKRGAKLHCAPIQLVKVGEMLQTQYTVNGRNIHWVGPNGTALPGAIASGLIRRVLDITVIGVTPKLAGWSFLGTLAHVEGVGTIIRAVPGISIPVQYREATPVCQHCNLSRTRNETFIVMHDDGTTKQVGRQCIADFLGHQNPEGIAAWVELLGGVDEMLSAAEEDDYLGGGGSSRGRLYDIVTVLSTASLMIRTFGWMSKTNAEIMGKCSTSGDVQNFMFGIRNNDWLKTFGHLKVEEEDLALANNALDWAREINLETASDYLYNLALYAKAEAIDDRGFGITVSLISTYKREVEKIELALREAAKPSEYFGTVGKREDFVLTVISIFDVDTQYGTIHIHKMADAKGNIAIWKTSSNRLNENATYTIKATVKEHSEYKNRNLPEGTPGRKQTELLRCKILDMKEAA